MTQLWPCVPFTGMSNSLPARTFDVAAHPPDDPHEMQYSNPGYCLLGIVLERVESQPLAEILRERVFDPLGMGSSGLEGFETLPVEPFARGYRRSEDDAEWIDVTDLTDGTIYYGSGSLVSTASDLILRL